MTTLITGGAGYIGSITARAVRTTGRPVVVLDTLENGHRAAVGDHPFVQGDVADSRLVEDVCRAHGVTEVIHFAAYKAVGESMANPAKYFDNNVMGSQRLLEALERAGVGRIVFSSTAAVYGTPRRSPVEETDEVEPESVYAETKLQVERTLAWYGKTSGMQHVILRYFNAAGASDDGTLGEDWRHSQNLIPHVMRALLVPGQVLRVFGQDYPTVDGTGVRDYIHVEDLARAHVAALEHLNAGGASSTFNVGTGLGASVLDVIRSAERASGLRVPYEIVERREGDVSEVVANPAKIMSMLGWQPTRTLDQTIASAWKWHSTHPHGHATNQEKNAD